MKKKIIIVMAIILLIVLTAIISINITNQINQKEQSNKEAFKTNVINPDRIVYRNKEKYYQIETENEIYNTIIEEMAKMIDTSKDTTIISQEEVDDMHESESFIEFDYNTASKNYILTLDEGKFAKMLDSGAELIETNLQTNSLKNKIEENIESIKYYTMEENKEYISTNTLSSIQYKYLEKFKRINSNIYQVIIDNEEDLELFKVMCNLKFEEEIPEDVFEQNVIVLTLSTPKDITVKINIGNLRYYYDNKESNTTYTAHLLVVSKIVNTNCIYNVDNTLLEDSAETQETNEKYNEQVSNIDEDIFVKDFDTYLNTEHESQNLTQEELDEIANEGFEQAISIAGEYSKDTQEVTTEEVYANNFFTRKTTETDTVYNTKKINCYVYTRTDSMLNGVSIYIDANTGKIIGGRAFGD